MLKQVHFVLIFVVLSLSSCISMSKKEREENMISQPTMSSSVQEALKGGHFTLGDWPNVNWWEAFRSDELNQIVKDALVGNPSIQAIKERVNFAKQRAIVVRSKLIPLLFFDANETWEWLSNNGLYHLLNPTLPRNANDIDLSLSFTYEFDFWAKNRNLYIAALSREKAEIAESKQVELVVTSAVAQVFFALKTNLYKRDLYRQLETVRKKTYMLQQLLQQKALLSKLTPSFGEERLLEASKLVSSIEEEIQVNYHILNTLRGEGPDAKLSIQNDLREIPEEMTIPDTISIDLLARRPDVMAAIWRVDALARLVSAAIADFLPDINLKGFMGYESLGFAKLLQPSSQTIGLVPSIHLPVYTAGSIAANVRSHRAEFTEAVFQYNDLLLQSTKEVTDLLAILESVYQKKGYQKEIVNRADFRWNLTKLNFKSGLDDLLQVYTLEEETIQKELENADLIYSQYAASIKLVKALGGGYTVADLGGKGYVAK